MQRRTKIYLASAKICWIRNQSLPYKSRKKSQSKLTNRPVFFFFFEKVLLLVVPVPSFLVFAFAQSDYLDANALSETTPGYLTVSKILCWRLGSWRGREQIQHSLFSTILFLSNFVYQQTVVYLVGHAHAPDTSWWGSPLFKGRNTIKSSKLAQYLESFDLVLPTIPTH